MNDQGNHSFCVFMPAYNAEKTLTEVLERITDEAWQGITALYVINDGSQDDTVGVCTALTEKYNKLHLHSFSQNKGYGSAVLKGLELSKASTADYAVCLHSDGQYPPEKMVGFVQDMATNSIDILQGSRHLDGKASKGGMPLYKIIAGGILVKIENFVFKMKMTDYHSGYVLYSRRALSSIPFEKLSRSFDFDLEVIATARSQGLTIEERAIQARYANEKSYLNPITYGLRVLRVIGRYMSGYYRAL
jgi:glycosyltransferase involved in cell wall biosynthesis